MLKLQYETIVTLAIISPEGFSKPFGIIKGLQEGSKGFRTY